MKSKPKRQPNLNKRQLNCLKNNILRGTEIPLGVTCSLIRKGYLVRGLYYNDPKYPRQLVPVRLPTRKARLLVSKLCPQEYERVRRFFGEAQA